MLITMFFWNRLDLAAQLIKQLARFIVGHIRFCDVRVDLRLLAIDLKPFDIADKSKNMIVHNLAVQSPLDDFQMRS